MAVSLVTGISVEAAILAMTRIWRRFKLSKNEWQVPSF
jgi:hypothetical protein